MRPVRALSTALAAIVGSLSAAQAADDIVNVYTSRHYDSDYAVYDAFEEATGIDVRWREAPADALIETMLREGEFSPADVFITVDAGRLWRAEEAGLLVPHRSAAIEEKIPAELRHPDGLWFGMSKRARIIIFDKAKGRPEGLNSYADLAKPEFEGQVCIRSSGNIYNISLLASIIAHEGAEAAEQWASGVASNFARRPQGNDISHIRSVAAGECRISVVNSYYLARFAGSDDAESQEIFDAVGVIFPNQDDRGTHVNISGAALTKNAPNRENALRFLEFLTGDQAQGFFTDLNNEYPAVENAEASAAVRSLGDFQADQINVRAFGEHQTEAVKIFDRVGWP